MVRPIVRFLAAALFVLPLAGSVRQEGPVAVQVVGRYRGQRLACSAGYVGRYLITAAHCGQIEGRRALWIGRAGDPDWDFAIYEGDGAKGAEPACRLPRVLERVTATLASRSRIEPTVAEGFVVSGLPVRLAMHVRLGDSGSPVVASDGVLGVVWGRPRRVEFRWMSFVSSPLALCAVYSALEGRAPMP